MSCLDLDSMIALNLSGLTIMELYSNQSIAKPDLNVMMISAQTVCLQQLIWCCHQQSSEGHSEVCKTGHL